MARSKISLSECFLTVQGEGQLIGKPTVFVRTGGCDYRCLSADTLITLHDLTQKPIELIQPGDMVLGYARVNSDTDNGPLRLVPTPVIATRCVGVKPTLRIIMDDGTELICSHDHRWWIEKLRNGWVWKSPKHKGLEGNYKEAQKLRSGDFIKGMGKAISQPEETDSWRKGYLRGAFDGDGHISRAWVAMRVTSRSFFDAVISISETVQTPLVEYAVGTTTHGTTLYRSRLPEQYRSSFMENIEWQENAEFARGYLAGMFDAEGHVPVSNCYYTQNKGTVCDRIQHALDLVGYKYRYWERENSASCRIYVEENPTAFLTQIDVRCAHKRAAAASRGINQQRKMIVSIADGPNVPLYDIQTGTQNFLANGMVSHNCSWCDSLYAVLPEHRSTWELLEPEEIFTRVQKLSPDPILITLSGGNPAIEPLESLIDMGHAYGYTFAIETQGTISKPWFEKLDYITISPKPPSSGMKTNWQRLDRCIKLGENTETALKVVVFDDLDYLYAQEIYRRYPDLPFYLQTGNPHVGEDFSLQEILDKTRWLIEKVVADRWNKATVLMQMHTLLWGSKRGI